MYWPAVSTQLELHYIINKLTASHIEKQQKSQSEKEIYFLGKKKKKRKASTDLLPLPPNPQILQKLN